MLSVHLQVFFSFKSLNLLRLFLGTFAGFALSKAAGIACREACRGEAAAIRQVIPPIHADYVFCLNPKYTVS